MLHKNQKGFTVIEIICAMLFLLVLCLLTFSFVTRHRDANTPRKTTSSLGQSNDSTVRHAAGDHLVVAELGFKMPLSRSSTEITYEFLAGDSSDKALASSSVVLADQKFQKLRQACREPNSIEPAGEIATISKYDGQYNKELAPDNAEGLHRAGSAPAGSTIKQLAGYYVSLTAFVADDNVEGLLCDNNDAAAKSAAHDRYKDSIKLLRNALSNAVAL